MKQNERIYYVRGHQQSRALALLWYFPQKHLSTCIIAADTSFQSTDSAVMSQDLNTSQEDINTSVLDGSFSQTQPQTQVYTPQKKKLLALLEAFYENTRGLWSCKMCQVHLAKKVSPHFF